MIQTAFTLLLRNADSEPAPDPEAEVYGSKNDAVLRELGL